MAIGWGFVGASTVGKQWMVGAVRAQPGHDVVALMSSSAERGAAYASEMNIANSYCQIEDLLADPAVNVVYVSTTNELHKSQVLSAARAGKHVLCEKPLALNLEDAVEMVEACRNAGVVMGTNHHLRNSATHQAIKAQIASGAIGKVVAVRIFHAVHLPESLRTWRVNNPKAGGGAILDIGVHDADTVRFLLDEDPIDVMAYSQNAGMSDASVEDGSMTIMRMPSGVLVQSHESFVVPYAGTGLEVHGAEGSIFAKGVMTQQPVGEVKIVNGKGEHDIFIQHHDLYEYSLSKFAKAIEGHGEAAVSGEDGVKSLAIALAIVESASAGRRVPVKYVLDEK